MVKFKVEYKLRCDSDVVYWIETSTMELPHNDYHYEHKATVIAMNLLLSMADELKIGNKKLEDFKIIWEE